MRDVLAEYEVLLAAGEPVGRAVVTRVFGSAPRPEGATLLATAGGKIAGSISGGCVEGAAAEAIRRAIASGEGRTEAFSVSDELAWEVGLSCGGTIAILVEPEVRPELVEAARGPGGAVVATALGHDGESVAAAVVRDDGPTRGPFPLRGDEAAGMAARTLAAALPSVEEAAREALRRETSSSRRFASAGGEEIEVFLEVFPRRPRLVVFGGVHVAAELVPLARRLGYRTFVADGRASFLTRERFPEADELVRAWPEEAFARIGLDPATYVCVLSHDPKFDEPALVAALRSPAAYVGAIGSRKTQAKRRRRLRERGLSEAQIGRLRGPIGLDLGGRHPAEVAVAILAEMTAVRYGGSGRPMCEVAAGLEPTTEQAPGVPVV